ncbi:DUF2852 domain-containing protein [Phreatobacter oligotrophus]|uniref:Uncharacterized protein DUF2852 n=1 Tax=Phreatobacter oligotrophus TaxID=1122261 RepID=A0A2T4Z131_9HYPH|nr:DUF2852 domain-containing protein [Phreatobacter oligotrophus]PTM53389.1 uncharacterized protein DUF2852 [Phreatobacter oligotrophus]
MTCLSSAPHTADRLPPFTGGWRGAADRRWHPVELTAMIVGFVIFWPIGLAVLAWKKWMGPLPREGRLPFGRHRDRFAPGASGNTAFDDYKEAELARLERERLRLFEEQVAFEAHLDRLKRARDRAEFDQFMAERQSATTPAQPAG